MDMSKVTPGQIIAALGGALLIISLFLDWVSGVTIQTGIGTVSTGGGSAWDVFSGMDIIMLLIGLAALGFAGASAMGQAGSLPSATGWIIAALGVCVFGWALGWDLENESAGIGSWLALVAAGAIAYGGYTAAGESAGVSTPPRSAPSPPPSARPSGTGTASPGEGTGTSSPPPRT